MARFEDVVGAEFPQASNRTLGGEIYVEVSVGLQVVNLSESYQVPILGIDAYIVGEALTETSLERIVDFTIADHRVAHETTWQVARELLATDFRTPWRPLQTGERYMLCFTWGDGPSGWKNATS